MKLHQDLVSKVVGEQEVVVGNLYPAKGGKKDSTEVWLVVALSPHGAHLLGFNKEGEICSTASYLRTGLKQRPILGKVDLSSLTIVSK
jgi:hypothetical protein